ncbi:MAG: hypothetical protein A2W01_03765 [Candidatus Solincola sediminis]|nr:MAG: hypothetical protein A2W01_03765 [Candidatus Solincola sediminis]
MKTRVLFGLLLAAFLLSGFISPGIAAAPPPDESGGKFILHPEEGKLADVVAEIVVQGASVQKALPQGNLLVEAPEGIGETSLSRLPGVSWAEPDIPFYAQTTPNDPDYARQWYLERINMPQAWDTASGGNPSVEIAVLDSGAAYRDNGSFTKAPDFVGTIFVTGHDFIENDDYPDDDYGHGTHMAAIIASTFGNVFRGAGMAYGCSIMPVKVLGSNGVGSASQLASGITWAADNGAKIISMSVASPRHSEAVGQAVAYAASKGVLCIAAAGNEGSDAGYPGGMDCPADEGDAVLAVGATDYRNERAHYSNYGSGLDLVAPGGDMTRDDNHDGYGDGICQESYIQSGNSQAGYTLAWADGTSMAAPQVAAVAGLILSLNPALTPAQTSQIITSTCSDIGSAGWDGYYGAGLLNAAAAVAAVGQHSWYFAEGTTRAGFEEWLCVLNPDAQDVQVAFDFLMSGGETKNAVFTVAAQSRFSLNVRSVVGDEKDVAAVVSSGNSIVAERPMYFNYQGKWAGGSDAKGTRRPSTDWYFAEGTTRAGFEEWLTLANPSYQDAGATIQYLVGAGQGFNRAQECVIPARSRITVNVNMAIGPELDVSLYINSSLPIVAERPMYFNYHDKWAGGADVIGALSPSVEWYFAEGTTRAGFEEWLTLANPGSQDATAHIDYLLGAGQGTNQQQDWQIPAHSRVTVNVNMAVGPEVDVSLHVTSSKPIVAERPMYFDYHGRAQGGHDVMGAPQAGNNWYFAEGTTRAGFEEWLTLANPGDVDAIVDVYYLLAAGQGSNSTKAYVIPAHSRITVSVNQDVGQDVDVSLHITSNWPIVAERPLYFSYGSQTWKGGTCQVGYQPGVD